MLVPPMDYAGAFAPPELAPRRLFVRAVLTLIKPPCYDIFIWIYVAAGT